MRRSCRVALYGPQVGPKRAFGYFAVGGAIYAERQAWTNPTLVLAFVDVRLRNASRRRQLRLRTEDGYGFLDE